MERIKTKLRNYPSKQQAENKTYGGEKPSSRDVTVLEIKKKEKAAFYNAQRYQTQCLRFRDTSVLSVMHVDAMCCSVHAARAGTQNVSHAHPFMTALM